MFKKPHTSLFSTRQAEQAREAQGLRLRREERRVGVGGAGDGRRGADHALHRPEAAAQVGRVGEVRRARDPHGTGE